METKKHDATTRAQKMRRGNEMGCAVRPRSGLFDIVKKDEGAGRRAAVPRAAFAILRAALNL